MPRRKIEQSPSLVFGGGVPRPFEGDGREGTMALLRQYEDSASRVAERLNFAREEIMVSWTKDEPLRVLHISDFHLFDLATSNEYVKTIEAELAKPGTVAMLYGDMIQGILPHTPEITTGAVYNFQNQITVFKERFLKKWVGEGKILGLVTGFDSHEGWAQRIMTLDAIRIMTDGLTQPDGTPLQMLMQGGRLVISMKDGQQHVIRAYHDPGSGGSDDVNPVGSQRDRGKETPLDAGDRQDSVVGGHYHGRGALSEEVVWRADTRREDMQTNVAIGTAQDVDDSGAPNLFLRKQAKGVSTKGGAATILVPDGGRMRTWSTHGVGRMGYLDSAARIWDRAERQGVTDEIIERAKEKLGRSVVRFRREESHSNAPNYRSRTRAPLFDNLKFQVNEPALPVAVCFLSNARFGSTSTNLAAIAEAVDRSVRDDRFLLLAGRHMIDSGVSKQYDRIDVINDMAMSLAPAMGQGRLLGLMLSKSLREDRWKGTVGAGKDRLPGLSTGDYLYFRSALKGLPLFENQTRVTFGFNRNGPEYRVLVMDGLDQSASSFDPFRGLVRAREQTRLTYEVVTGGNGRGVGVLTSGDTVYVAPGWFAKYDTRGKINTLNLPLGGNGWIMHPSRRMVIGAPTFAELGDRHEAMVLLESARVLGIDPETLVVRKGRKTEK